MAVVILPFFQSCRETENEELVELLVATPLTLSLDEFRAELQLLPPVPINESGKIYAYEDLILVSEPRVGVHLIDNSDPGSPSALGFIPVVGNRDMSVKGDVLYVDSLSDLIALDISDPQSINQLARLEGVLMDPVPIPWEADIFEYDKVGPGEVVVDWEVKTEFRRVEDMPVEVLFAEDRATPGAVGQGGSLARFKIVGDYLYAVDSHNINIFDISDLGNPSDVDTFFAGFDIETIFNQGENLFLGSRRGMYIYNITNPAQPSFVSEFQHGTACDPVVVEGDYAYVTLRGGNDCGATESGLYIVDIQQLSNPELLAFYPMDGPYGLGFHGSQMYVCDGDSGLKVYDKSDLESLQWLETHDYQNTFDVIPLDSHLILVAGRDLVQFAYVDKGLEVISEYALMDP